MSREAHRKPYFNRDPRDRDRRDVPRDPHIRVRDDYRLYDKPRPTIKRSPNRDDKRRSRSPRKTEPLDDNILSEISKLPEPSELWDTHQDSFPPPPAFSSETIPSAGYQSNYQQQTNYSGIYDEFPPMASVPPPPQPPEWNQMSIPPPPTATAQSSSFIPNMEEQIKREAAIESEMRHQKAALSKQREDYIKKSAILKKELDTLKDQRNELRGDSKRSPSPDTKRFLKENTKLQLEIQNKLKTINNVVDMLNGIIGEEAQAMQPDSDDSGDRPKRKSRSPTSKKFNYVYYDPEMHWCRVCNEFPSTAKDYLNHLHSPAHHKMAAAHMEAPWHTVSGMNEGFPSYTAAPTKRTPIRGLQFFVPSTAWYCKLCDQFIGDLHCASAHLKSITHSKNYSNFVEQNPHWETDWMSDRQKSFEKARGKSKAPAPAERPADGGAAGAPGGDKQPPQQYAAHTITFNKDGFHTKRKDKSPSPADEKKKKDKKKKSKKRRRESSSSSSSSSSSEDSEPVKKKKNKKKVKSQKKAEDDDKMLAEWMTSIQRDRLSDTDRKLLDTLKSRMKDTTARPVADRAAGRAAESRVQPRRDRDSQRRSEERRSPDRSRSEERARARQRNAERSVKERLGDPRAPAPKKEPRKMPFIGKMPVFKTLTKSTKPEDQRKDEDKKKEDDEVAKKRREEMDAEIQKKVAEFKEKIAKAQQERELAVANAGVLGPPQIALPTELGSIPRTYAPPPQTPAPPPPQPPPQPPQPPPTPTMSTPTMPALPKDFQEALDIIFPTSDSKKAELGNDGLFPTPPMAFPGLFQAMPPLGMMPPHAHPHPPPLMMGFDMYPRPQLYDTHVPLVPKTRPAKPAQQRTTQGKGVQRNRTQGQALVKTDTRSQVNAQAQKEKNGNVEKKKEELDDLAMLGIDASDVGAGI